MSLDNCSHKHGLPPSLVLCNFCCEFMQIPHWTVESHLISHLVTFGHSSFFHISQFWWDWSSSQYVIWIYLNYHSLCRSPWICLGHSDAFWSSDLTESTQVGNSHRYGTCDSPGAAYFFQRTRIASGERKPPAHCSSYTVFEDPWNQCNVGRLDTYFKSNATVPGWIQVNVEAMQPTLWPSPFYCCPDHMVCFDMPWCLQRLQQHSCSGFGSPCFMCQFVPRNALDSIGLVQHSATYFKDLHSIDVNCAAEHAC